MDDLVVHKIKHKHHKRKARYTFPNELDEPVRQIHTRRYSIPTQIDAKNDYDSYDEKHVIITKTVEGVKKEVIVKKYKKVHPVIEKQILENGIDEEPLNNSEQPSLFLGILYKSVVKILLYLGILSCIVI
jgi:hypothetical protein